jgi:RNA polymerase sigma-70 factor (ECF subfamily)
LNSPTPAPASPIESQFETLFLAVYRYFRYRGADPQQADDLSAAVFERALSRKETYDPRKGCLRTWLLAIAHNTVVNAWAQQARRPVTSLESVSDFPAPDPLPEEAVIRRQDIAEALAALQTLGEREREVVALKLAGSLTNRQVGGLVGLSEDHVAVILHRAFQRLKNRLGQAVPEGNDHG